MKDHEVLGVSIHADRSETESAYRKHCKDADARRVEEAYKRMLAVMPAEPCPAIRTKNQIFFS